MASVFNQSVCRQMTQCLGGASEPCVIFNLELVKSRVKSAIHYCRKQLLQRKQRTYRAITSNIFNITVLCIAFILFTFHASGVHFIEDLPHNLFRFFVTCFDVFGSDSIAVCCLAFLESFDCVFVRHFFVVISRKEIHSSLSHHFQSFSCRVPSQSLHLWSSSYILLQKSPKNHWQFLS